MSEKAMMRSAAGALSALMVLGMLGGCNEGSRPDAAGWSAPSAAPASASVTGMGTAMPMARRHMNMRAPVVAPVSAKTTGSCPAIDSALVDEGRNVFVRAGGCYACHGPDARGSGMAPGLTGSIWLDIDGSYPAIAQVVQEGVVQPSRFPAAMPAMGGAKLDGEQVCAVAAYVFSLSH